MTSVIWKLYIGTLIWSLQVLIRTDGQLQDAISMSSDGWRPIVGTRQEPLYQDAIFHYRNPSSRNDYSVRAAPIITTTTTTTTTTPAPTTRIPITTTTVLVPTLQQVPKARLQHNKHHQQPTKKIPPHSKHPFYPGLPMGVSHGPHIPLGAVTHMRPGQSGQILKMTSSKPFVQMNLSGKRRYKPIRIAGSAPNRDDIFLESSSSAGAYSLYKQMPKTRETIGLGVPTGNHFIINQPHAHIEFSNNNNRYPPPPTSENIFQKFGGHSLPPPPLQSINPGFPYIKHPHSNDVNYPFHHHPHGDDFTRNLVPPPFHRKKEPSKEKITAQVPPPVQVQVTKEKLNVFHQHIPQSYNGDYVEYDFHSVKRPTTDATKHQTYEVTENKNWRDTSFVVPAPQHQVELNVPPFLPTPYRPEGIVPTSPTQAEVSTIFSKLTTKMQSQENFYTPYDVKEVSTHYPILGKPSFEYETTNPYKNEISETKEQAPETTTPTTTTPRAVRPSRKRRPSHRFRTSSTTTSTTTTEEPSTTTQHYNHQYYETPHDENQEPDTERPVRRRPLHRYRNQYQEGSSEAPVPKRTRTRYRVRTTTPETETEAFTQRYHHQKVAAEEEYYQTTELVSMEMEPSQEDEQGNNKNIELELPGRHYSPEVQEEEEAVSPIPLSTEPAPTTNLHLPEMTESVNTVEPSSPQTLTEAVAEETIATTAATTTTPPPPKNNNRVRRPIKYDNSNRPRFSVKDYRQKYSSTTSSPTTAQERSTASSLDNLKNRSRLRRPSTSSSTTTESPDDDGRSKFVPKEPRHGETIKSNNIIGDKGVKAVNTRLRPFGRFRSTTVATTTSTTPKVSIKPNLFAARRRPPMLSLRSKIYNKYNQKNATEEVANTTAPEAVKEEDALSETTSNDVDGDDSNVEETTSSDRKQDKVDEEEPQVESTTADILKHDSYIYSQRVSDLTSSSKNEYDTPGLFKSVSHPTSRRIPSHFTISTDDPILPIEAFFPNLKDKDKSQDK